MSDAFDVAVIGAGPAGVATACALRRLGHRVVLFGESRNTAIEGLSERTLSRIRAAGLESAAACIRGPGERTGVWGATEAASSREYLIERAAFDAGLREDALAAGVELQAHPVAAVEPAGKRWLVRAGDYLIECLVVIEARGRHARGAPLRGPRLVAVSQRFEAARTDVVRTAIQPMADGWCWLADDGCGTRWVQVIGAPNSVHTNAEMPVRIAESLKALPAQASFLEGAVAVGSPTVRAAVAKMSLPATARGMLRVGDASIAMDPLSGHGIYEALESARAAVAATHSYLERDDWDTVAQLMNDRVREAWVKMTTTAAHFYSTQAAHSATAFWMMAASAYESLAAAARFGKQSEARDPLPMPFALGG